MNTYIKLREMMAEIKGLGINMSETHADYYRRLMRNYIKDVISRLYVIPYQVYIDSDDDVFITNTEISGGIVKVEKCHSAPMHTIAKMVIKGIADVFKDHPNKILKERGTNET